MPNSALVQKTAQYVKQKLFLEPTGHDWYHVERAWKIAKKLQKKEGGDLEIIELAVLLHDLGDYKQYNFNEVKGSLVLHGMMDILEIEEEMQEKIIDITLEAQYSGDDTKTPSSIEGKIVQDADWLDALGAIGIARVFATGGSIKRVLHDPERKPRKRLSKVDYQRRKQEGTSYNYFYEKILKLPKMMNTPSARKIAQERVKFVKEFINQFMLEWEGEDYGEIL